MSQGVVPSEIRRAFFADPIRAARNWGAISALCTDVRISTTLGLALANALVNSADPDMVLNNLERFITAHPDKPSLIQSLVQRPSTLQRLTLIFSSSQSFSDVMIARPTLWTFLEEHGHEPLRRSSLRTELRSALHECDAEEAPVLQLLRQVRQRELLRVGYRDIVHGHSLESITTSISDLADILVDTALQASLRQCIRRFGKPITTRGNPAQIAIIAMGKLGGRELNYSSDIDLIALFDEEGQTDGRRPLDHSEFFSEVVRRLIRFLSASTVDGVAYRVDFRLRPHGSQAALCLPLETTVNYYDREGRTWERQAMVKARPIAGAKHLGTEFLSRIQDFVYRRQLTFVEINEIRAIKHNIENRTLAAGLQETDLKTGRGGIRDIEFVIQFLQLINGAHRPELRQRTTLRALSRLHQAGLLTVEEFEHLELGYRFLRKAEHRLQFLFDLQRHDIPSTSAEISKLAIRLGYAASDNPAERFLDDLRRITDRNRQILHRLMMDVFPNTDDDRLITIDHPITDLILDPEPSAERIRAALEPLKFRDITTAYQNLNLLGRETVPFLSSARSRHFLASVAPKLLREIAAAPDPDMALTNLEKVSASLGAKGVLWESMAQNDSLLRLFVSLCAWSQFLSEILINNPGMIDELLDTLTMAKYPSRVELESELEALLRGAVEIDPILHGFRNTKLMAIGIRDLLGKISVQQATSDLADLAEIILGRVAERHFSQMSATYGVPILAHSSSSKDTTSELNPCAYVLLGLGKLGGREIGYHSDLDLVLVYEGDGFTRVDPPTQGRQSIDSFQFFSELAQRIVRTLSWMGPLGRLYSVDLRLRPTGSSGSLVAPLSRFQEYYRHDAQTWEMMAITRARVVHGQPTFGWKVLRSIHNALASYPVTSVTIDDILAMRRRLEESRSPFDLKRGAGGLMDIEFIVQLMQLKHSVRHPAILESNVWKALARIAETGLWSPHRVAIFREGYSFLRKVESRIRIVQNLARNDLPSDPSDLAKLALRFGGYAGENPGMQLQHDVVSRMQIIRKEFQAALNDERERR